MKSVEQHLDVLSLLFAEFDLSDFFDATTTTTKAPAKVVPKAPTGTKAPVKPKPKPGQRVPLPVCFLSTFSPETGETAVASARPQLETGSS